MGCVGDYTLEFHPYHLIFFDGTKVRKIFQTTKCFKGFNTNLTYAKKWGWEFLFLPPL